MNILDELKLLVCRSRDQAGAGVGNGVHDGGGKRNSRSRARSQGRWLYDEFLGSGSPAQEQALDVRRVEMKDLGFVMVDPNR